MTNTVYLGRVLRVTENYGKSYRHATVEPLVYSSADQTRWIGSIINPIEEFPSRGVIYWHDPPIELKEGDIRQFDLTSHPFYNGEPDKEAYQVNSHKYPIEILDLRDLGSERNIRMLMTTKGVFLRDEPFVKRCLLWVQNEKWVGPVNLDKRNGTSSWVLAPDQDIKSIRCWKISPEAIQQVDLDGIRLLLAPNEKLGKHNGFVTWESDEVLAKRVLSRIFKRDKKTAEAFKVSKKIFSTYIELIEQAGLIGSDLNFYERIKEILEVISRNDEILDEAVKICFNIDPIKNKIDIKAEAEYQRKLDKHKARLDQEMTAKRFELETINHALLEKNEELQTIERENQAFDEKLKKRLSTFEAELGEKLCDLAKKPERLFTEMAITNGLININNIAPKPSRVLGEKKNVESATGIATIEDHKKLMGDLNIRLLHSGCLPFSGKALHSALLAGLIPVLVGPEAYEVVSSYADCVSGGVLHWIPVGGSVFEPSDLLARFDPTSRCLVPHSGGLLDLLMDESDTLHIVVLEGFNRAAVDGYLMPLLKSAQDITLDRKPRSIPLAPPGFVSEYDPYSGVSRIAWSRNILLVLCPAYGSSTLPLPSEFWAHCTVINHGDPVLEGLDPALESIPEVTRVPATTWKTWSGDVKRNIEPLEILRKQPKGTKTLPLVILGNIQRVYKSGASLGMKQEIALDYAVKTCLLPYLLATEESVETWFRHFELVSNEVDRKIADVIQRLGD
jgi:hypothetical protein